MKKIPPLFLLLAVTTACTVIEKDSAASTGNEVPAAVSSHVSTATAVPSPTEDETFASDESPPPEPFYLMATVWRSEPRVPILVYHRFLPDHYEFSTQVKMRLGDFRAHLESLYASGFSLVSLGDWLAGNLHVPEGRRPLILTIDDAFFADQISLTVEGEPSPASGLGVLWNFYRENPEFGFAVSLFPCLGDKLYPGGEIELARVIAWCIEHDVIPYNHFYTHPRLKLTATKWITWEAEMNDRYLRELLSMVDREDMASRLGNIIALTYGEWPESADGRRTLLSYVSPEGTPLQAILEVDFAVRAKYLSPPYSSDFDRWHIPRIVGTQDAIDLLSEQRETFPSAEVCEIGPLDRASLANHDYLARQIYKERRGWHCPDGDYVVEGAVFRVDKQGATLLSSFEPSSLLEAGALSGFEYRDCEAVSSRSGVIPCP